MEKAKGLAALRVVLGSGFLYAGLEKIFDFAGSGKPFSAAGFLRFGTTGTLPGSAPGRHRQPDPRPLGLPGHQCGHRRAINWLVVVRWRWRSGSR